MVQEAPPRGNAWPDWLRRVLGLAPTAAPRDPATLFTHFQAVLAGNNQALEAITDLGEKLGGDYLFDVNYTRKAYGELFAAISEALANFTLLTGNAYPVLAEILARIDRQVRRLLSEGDPEHGPLVVFYPEITWDLAEAVGGKNYHLAVLGNDLNLRIPDSFAVTTTAFDLFCDHNGLKERLAGLAASADPEKVLEELRQAILSGTIPEPLAEELARATRKLAGRQGERYLLAVRSSGEEEDGDFSFAGQFESVLNVPADPEKVGEAWKRVAASLFGTGAVAYQRAHGYRPGSLRMAAACVTMIEARVSGVIFTAAEQKRRDNMLISAAWGLGPAVVDGITDADLYTVNKEALQTVVESRIGRKEVMVVSGGAGIVTVPTPEAMRDQPCLTETQVLELAGQARRIEEYFQGPQDIEWAIDVRDRIFILQSRKLRLEEEDTAAVPEPGAGTDLPILLRDRGVVVRKGTTAGRVFRVREIADLERVPKGAILVTHHDSPQVARVIPFVNAIITDTGTPTSHMASICREFAIPTVINTENGTELLPEGREITLQAGDHGFTVFAGVARQLLQAERRQAGKLRELYEFRRQKYLMRYIAPLHLVNPLEEEFAPEKCRSVHDLIRFMHEKAVQALVAGATRQAASLTNRLLGRAGALHDLALPIPIRLLVLDIGGAVARGSGRQVVPEQVESQPLRAILAGLLAPGFWSEEALPLTGRDFLAGMTRATDPGVVTAATGVNLAVATAEYVNLSLRFGYHFNMLDSYCTPNPHNNHIFFRFVGGAAAITSRSLRIHFMAKVMGGLGFLTKPKGDLLVARISNLPPGEVLRLLENLGRLIGFARQLDAAMTSEEAAEQLARDFLAEKTA